MNALLIWYPKCSTCQKAKAWLDEHGVACETRHIVEETPTAAELADWHARSGLPLKRFFNTSGLVYKNEHIKDERGGAVRPVGPKRHAHQAPVAAFGGPGAGGLSPRRVGGRPLERSTCDA